MDEIQQRNRHTMVTDEVKKYDSYVIYGAQVRELRHPAGQIEISRIRRSLWKKET